MATPGVAVPGSVVPVGAAVAPGGAQGIQGVQGPAGTGGGGGGGSGTLTMATFKATDAFPVATNYAYFGTRLSGSLGVMQFLKTGNVDTSLIFAGVLPQGATLTTGLKIILFWASTTATTGAVEWQASIDNLAAHSIDSDSYGTAVSQVSNTSGTAASMNSATISLPNANLQSLAAEMPYKLLIKRQASDTSNDTMTDVASLFLVEVKTY
jgi:hypothetical protein